MLSWTGVLWLTGANWPLRERKITWSWGINAGTKMYFFILCIVGCISDKQDDFFILIIILLLKHWWLTVQMRYLSFYLSKRISWSPLSMNFALQATLTINHILPLHHFFGVLLDVLLLHCQTPGLRLQVLGVGVQFSPHCRIMSIWKRHTKNKNKNKNKITTRTAEPWGSGWLLIWLESALTHEAQLNTGLQNKSEFCSPKSKHVGFTFTVSFARLQGHTRKNIPLRSCMLWFKILWAPSQLL